jgi:hypothetical protein
MQKQLIPRVLEGLAQVMLSNARTVQWGSRQQRRSLYAKYSCFFLAIIDLLLLWGVHTS